ncbi:hypothetical protein BGZ98_010413, partial [Dissophora globulifera]
MNAQYRSSDDKQAVFLKCMRRVTGWSAGDFGPKSFQVLRGHWATLKTLDLSSYDSKATTAMLQEVMSSCPLLEILRWRRVNVTDILGDGPWVCMRLRNFEIPVMFRPSESDRLQPVFFERLSELTALEYLDLCGTEEYSDMQDVDDNGVNDGAAGAHAHTRIPFNQPLEFRVERGLDKLATLRSLRAIDFKGTRQQMNMTDVEWMLAHWPKLGTVF